jgi:hypothetical protein
MTATEARAIAEAVVSPPSDHERYEANIREGIAQSARGGHYYLTGPHILNEWPQALISNLRNDGYKVSFNKTERTFLVTW